MVSAKRLDLAAATGLLSAGYSALVFCFVAAFHRRIEHAAAHAALNAGIVLVVVLLYLLRSRGRAFEIAFLFHPVFLYAVFYSQTGLINQAIVSHPLDAQFLAADELLFGRFPGFYLHALASGRFLDELMHFFYFSYYLSIPTVALIVSRKGRHRLACFFFHLSALFYLCYAIFIVLPVEGPMWLRNAFFQGPSFFRAIVDFIFEKAENGGAAFPSSHVAVAVLVAWWGSRELPRLRWLFVLQASMLSVATVYCAYHYAVDVAGGLVLGYAAIALWKGRAEAILCRQGGGT